MSFVSLFFQNKPLSSALKTYSGRYPFSLVIVLSFFFFLSYIYIFFSTVQRGDPVTHTYIHSFFSHYMFHHNWLDRVPSATQQDPITNPFQRQHSASVYPKFPVPPTPSPSPLATQVYSPSPWFSFLWKDSFVLYIRFQICDIIWYWAFSFGLSSLRMRVSSSIHHATSQV